MSAAILCLSLVLGTKPLAYPKAELIIEPAALADRLDKSVILDVRSAKAYGAGHIPGAIRVDLAEFGKAFAARTDTRKWSAILGGLGMTADSSVVVYGDSWTNSARVWWILRYWGLKDVRLLNGPFAAWTAIGGKVSTEPVNPAPVRGQFTATDRLATKDQVLDILKDKSSQLLDARSEGEFCGNAGQATKKGSIPGAVNLEWKEFVDAKTGKLKTGLEIAETMRKAGIDPLKPVVTYCQSGGRAAMAAFVLELMGGEKVRNYYRSWAEWGNAEDTPVAKPGAKK